MTSTASLVAKHTEAINSSLKALRQLKRESPKLRVGFTLNRASLLNAYREGDIEFGECIELMGGITLTPPVETERPNL